MERLPDMQYIDKSKNMRNSEYLDNPMPGDERIGGLFYEDGIPYRMVNGEKIQQLEPTEENKDLNLIMNRVRASGMRPSEYLKMMYRG